MKILLISDFAGYGGTKTYFLLLVDYLLKRHHSLEVLLASRQSIDAHEYEHLKQAGVQIKYLPGFLVSKNKVVKRLRIDKISQFLYLLFSVHGPFDQVIVSSGHSFNFLSGAWIWGKRFCIIQHTYPQGTPSAFTKYFSGLRATLFKSMARRGFVFITVSEYSKKIIQDFVALPDLSFPVKVVYNTCQIVSCTHDPARSKTIVTAGHLEKWKNPEFWLEVALSVTKQDNEVSFVWAGTGSLMDSMSKKIPENYQSRIRLAGYTEDVSGLLSTAAIYFQPSLVENHSLSVIEAMACSLPCVVSNAGGLPEAVEDGVNGYVVELNRDEVARKLLYLINNQDIAIQMGKSGYQKFLQEYTLEAWQEKMDRLLFNRTKK